MCFLIINVGGISPFQKEGKGSEWMGRKIGDEGRKGKKEKDAATKQGRKGRRMSTSYTRRITGWGKVSTVSFLSGKAIHFVKDFETYRYSPKNVSSIL